MIKKIIVMVTVVFSLDLMASLLPVAPINIGAYNFTSTTVRLSFKNLSDNEDGFIVYHNRNMISQVDAKDGTGKYHYINLNNLESCKLYTIGLVSYNSNGESSPLIKSFRTLGCDSPEDENRVPTANAGVDKNITLGDSITIRGSGFDSDGTIISYVWKRGDTILSNEDVFNYRPTTKGIDILTLTVTDNDGAKATDSMQVIISDTNNITPVAPINIGAYNFTSTTARLSFKDLSNNEEGFRVYYNGNMISQVDAKDGIGKYHYVNIVNLEPCKLYTIGVVSYNSRGESSPLIKSFRTIGCDSPEDENRVPTANAGANRSITLGDSITIRGSGFDSDGTIISYVWKRGDIILSSEAVVNYEPTTKGVYTLTLTVTDNDGAQASDSMQVFVNDSRDDDNDTIPVDITLFGAIPNDDIDDTDAIERALSVSGSITMPTGVYRVKELARVGKTLIEGNGSTFKSIRTVAGTSSNILTLRTEEDSDKIWIKNLKLDGDCPNQYPKVGENVSSLLHIYDSKNILLERVLVVDYSSQYHIYDFDSGDEPELLQVNNDHSLDMPHTIFISFSRDIIIRDMEQRNIKIEGPIIYESDNIIIEDFKSIDSVSVWTALHVVASDNIVMKRVNVSDGLVNSRGSSINFFANHYFTVSDVNTTHKHGFDISNEVVGVPTGRVTRDTSYGTFLNCRFEGYHPVQGYPTKRIHEDLKFIDTKFIPSRVEKGAYGVRLEKAGEVVFTNCIFGNENVVTRFNMIMGNTRKLTVTNSEFINTEHDKPLAAGIYILGGEYGDINVTGNSFDGVNYSPVLFMRYGPIGRVNIFRFINNIYNEDEFEYGTAYKNFNLTIDKIVD